MITPLPAVGIVAQQPVDLDLGADVDAAGRLVDDEHPGRRGQPAGQQDLLLVSAREGPHLLVGVLHGDAQLPPILLGQLAAEAPAAGSRPGSSARARRRGYYPRRSGRGTSPAPSGPPAHRRCRPRRPRRIERNRRGRPSRRRVPRVEGIGGENGPHQLRPAGAEKPREAEDLAPAQREADLVRAPRETEPVRRRSRTSPNCRGLRRVELAEVAADHGAEDIRSRHLRGLPAGDAGAVAEDGDPVADPEDLVQAVGDIDDRRPTCPSACGSSRARARSRGSPSAEVGSSKMMTCGSQARALRTSTTCR